MAKMTNEMILKRGVIVNTIGVVTRFSKALYVILFSTFLGAEKFGIYSYAFAIFDVICTIVQFGYGQALAVQFGKYKHQGLEKYILKTGNYVLGFAALIGAIIAVILYFSIPVVFNLIGHESAYVPAVQIFCIAIPAFSLKYNILFALRASFDTRPEAVIVSMIEPILIFVFALIVFHFKADVYLACAAMVVAYYVSCLCAYWTFVRKFKRAENVMDPDFRMGAFLKRAYPIAFMETMNMIIGRSDMLFLGYFVDVAMVGIYGAAVEITSMIMKVRAAVEPTLGNLVQKIHQEENKTKTQRWLTKSMFWTLMPTAIIVGAIILSPNFFMSFFHFDDKYRAYFMILSMLAVGRLLHAVFGLIDVPLYMVDHSFSAMKISLLNFVSNFVLFVLLIPKYGVMGAGAGFVISAIITCVYRLYLSNKIFKILPIDWTFIIPVASFFVALAVTKPIQLRIRTNILMTAALIVGYVGIYLLVFQVLRKRFKQTDKMPA